MTFSSLYSKKFLRTTLVPAIIILSALFWWGLHMEDGTYHWQWKRACNYILRYRGGEWIIGPLLEGLWVSLKIVGASFVLALFLGLGTALLRYIPSRVGQTLAAAYVGLVRNTPLLIQLFVMYFVLAPVFQLSPFWAAAWTLAAFEGAYMAEIFRAGIEALPKSQWDAAYSLGFNARQIFTHVLLPQALRRILPPLTGQSVSLVKDSALVSAIAIPDLTMQAQIVIADTFLSLELWILVAVMYVMISLLLTLPAKILEKQYSWQWL